MSDAAVAGMRTVFTMPQTELHRIMYGWCLDHHPYSK